MKRTLIGIVVIGMLVGGVLLAKSMRSQPAAEPASSETTAATTSLATTSPAQPQVILFADPKEAEDSCGCGEIIRAVRAAGTSGVRTREVDPEREEDVVRQYRVTVAPTVIFVDPTGKEVSRREGESGDTIAAIQTELDRLAAGRQ